MRAIAGILMLAALAPFLSSCENVKRGIYESSQQVERGRAEDSGVPTEPPSPPSYQEYKEMRKQR